MVKYWYDTFLFWGNATRQTVAAKKHDERMPWIFEKQILFCFAATHRWHFSYFYLKPEI